MTVLPNPHLWRRQFYGPLLKAEQTRCGFPWSQTSRFCRCWWSQLTGQWANPGHRPQGLSSSGRPAMNTRSWLLPLGLPSTTSCRSIAEIRVLGSEMWWVKVPSFFRFSMTEKYNRITVRFSIISDVVRMRISLTENFHERRKIQKCPTSKWFLTFNRWKMYKLSNIKSSSLVCLTPVEGWRPQQTGGPAQSWLGASCSVHPTWPPLTSSPWTLPSKGSYRQRNYKNIHKICFDTCKLSIKKLYICFYKNKEIGKFRNVRSNAPAHPVHSNAIWTGDVFDAKVDSSTNVVTAIIHWRYVCSLYGTWYRVLSGYSEVHHTWQNTRTSSTSSSDLRFIMMHYLALLCVWPTEPGVVVVPVIVQGHNALLFLEEVVVSLRLQVEPSDTDVLW